MVEKIKIVAIYDERVFLGQNLFVFCIGCWSFNANIAVRCQKRGKSSHPMLNDDFLFKTILTINRQKNFCFKFQLCNTMFYLHFHLHK